MESPQHPPAMEFPHVRTYLRLSDKESNNTSIYDVKFYPYLEPGADPVFSAVAGRDIYVCRPGTTSDTPIEILNVLHDPQEDASLNSIVWSQDLNTADPLVCVAGSRSKKIKVWNAVTGELVRVVSGHGGDINDLVTSPRSSQILASCSADYTIRLWNLDPKYQKQPCAAILSGEGHRQAILSLAFHANGKWLLSGGQDTMICLWAVPDVPDHNAGTDKPTMVYYPHFASIDIHSDYVDCVRFWGDFVLSRASVGSSVIEKTGDIILWKIDGFDANSPTPPAPPMAAQGQHTRSAFGGRFQRLLTFQMQEVAPFYMRFGLFDQIGHRPILVMGNEKARYSFWDLQKLEEGYEAGEEAANAAARSKKRKRGSALSGGLARAASNASNTSSARNSHVSSPAMEQKFDISDPYARIAAHKMITVNCPINFACRAVSWSTDGKWCVAVGDMGMMVLFQRWK